MSLIDIIRDNYVLYVLGSSENIPRFCMNPFGLEAIYVNPLIGSSKIFVDLLIQLDGIGYGDKKLSMEKWVALDCGMLPSAFVGLAKRVKDIEENTREKFDFPCDYDGIVPVTMYCAIPAADHGLWIGHSLVTADEGKGLGLATKIIGLTVYQAKRLRGIAQYNNRSVKTHSKIGDLKLISALTFAHSIPDMTFVYEHDVDDNRLANALNNRLTSVEPSFLLRLDDHETKQRMQQEIESGVADFFIIPPGQIFNGDIYIPIFRKEK